MTYLSFLTFLLDLRVGERLGFGMALALVVVAQQIVTTGLMPVSNQRLWLDKFVAWSFYWVLLAVVQSVIIGFLFYIRKDREEEHRLGPNDEEIELVEKSGSADERRRGRDNSANDDDSGDGNDGDGDASVVPEHSRSFAVHSLEDITMKSFRKLTVKTDSFVQTVSLRKLDMVSLFFAMTTYTAFIVIMYSTISTGAWLRDEPKWFSEEDFSYDTSYYANHDPNN